MTDAPSKRHYGLLFMQSFDRPASVRAAIFSLLAGSYLAACSPTPAQPSAPPAAEISSGNPGELALIELAHKKASERMQRELVFDQETISDISGAPFACGHFTTATPELGKNGYFAYNTDGLMIFGEAEPQAWQRVCSNGWKPGSGSL